MAPARVISDEELLQLPDDGNRYEVVDGELVVSPGAGLLHERIVRRLLARLDVFVTAKGLGEAFPSNLLYRLPSGNRRGPDVSFIRAELVTSLARTTVFPSWLRTWPWRCSHPPIDSTGFSRRSANTCSPGCASYG